MRPFILCITGLLLFGNASAQIEREDLPAPNTPQIQLQTNGLIGKVLDKSTGRGMEAVTVQLYAKLRAADGTVKDSLLAGMFTRSNGDFSFSNLPPADSFRVLVSGIGYKDWEKTIAWGGASRSGVDLGNISLEADAQVLGGVTVTSQRPTLSMGIDRKVFSVEGAITSAGGTALDVMRNIPSVSVDVEGNVQLRNASPQIFIDGRPTIMTLDQIPADQIERVELITNPSARFDAASSGGIINVVMKRNRRVGLNGIVSAGVGIPDVLTGNVTLNARQGKVNLFVSGGYNQSGGEAEGRTLRQNKTGGLVSNYFNQYSTNERQRRFTSLRFGLDFFATNRSTFSLTQNIASGKFENDERQDQEYLNVDRVLERYGDRVAEGQFGFDRYNTQLNFTHKFPEQGKELSANVNYSYGTGSDASRYINTFYHPNGTLFADPARVRNEGSNNNDQYTFQIDYVDPHGEEGKLEAGLRSFINDQKSYFSSFSINNGTETLLPLSNNYAFNERINAAYISYSGKMGSIGYQAGLRAEHSSFEGELLDSARKFGYDYPRDMDRFFDGLFPSLFLTKQVGEGAELQVNYTRRIRRPNFWQLNPFIDINDPVNLSQGNPELQPEFTNSFEFNYNQKYNGGNFLGVVYYRNNMRDITRYSDTISAAQYAQLNNAAVDPNAILNTFINARSTNRLGAELTLQHKIGNNFEITPTVDMQYRKVNADVEDLRLSNEGFTWEGKLTLNYRLMSERSSLFRDLGLQLMGEYESREVTAQGHNDPQYRIDFGLRKDFLKDKKATLTFNINDIFNSHRYINIYDTDAFYQESFRRRQVRNFRLTLSYKFGKDNFTFNRREDRGGDRDDD